MKKNRKGLLIFVCILFSPFYLLAQHYDKVKELDKLMDDYKNHKHFNGVVLVAEKGQEIFRKAYGYANFEWKIKNTTDTKFRIASITKGFIAILIMQEVEKGSLLLDGKINNYLPDYNAVTAEQITIHQLLTHSSGIIDFTEVVDPENFDVCERKYHTKDDLLEYFQYKELLFEPGSQFKYSNFNYVLLALILEKVTGKSYKDLIQEKIFAPAAMINSGIDDNISLVKKRAQGYYRKFLTGENENATYVDMSVVVGAGDIYSTVEDMFKFDQALTKNLLISQESLSVILSPNMFPNMQNYGYGWDIRTEKWGKDGEDIIVYGSAGSINGFKSNYRRFDDGNCIIVLSNYKDRSGTSIEIASTSEIVNDIAAILYNRNFNSPLISGVAIIGKMILNNDIDSLNNIYDRLLKDSTIDFNAEAILELSNYFLEKNEIFNLKKLINLHIENLFMHSVDLSKLAALYYVTSDTQKAENVLSAAMKSNQYGENLLIYVGYIFLNRNQNNPALYLFEKNINYYPESYNAYDSYGEALLKNGQVEIALENYRKSLELNPDNTNAKEIIEQHSK